MSLEIEPSVRYLKVLSKLEDLTNKDAIIRDIYISILLVLNKYENKIGPD